MGIIGYNLDVFEAKKGAKTATNTNLPTAYINKNKKVIKNLQLYSLALIQMVQAEMQLVLWALIPHAQDLDDLVCYISSDVILEIVLGT